MPYDGGCPQVKLVKPFLVYNSGKVSGQSGFRLNGNLLDLYLSCEV